MDASVSASSEKSCAETNVTSHVLDRHKIEAQVCTECCRFVVRVAAEMRKHIRGEACKDACL